MQGVPLSQLAGTVSIVLGGAVAAIGPFLLTCGPTPGGLCGMPAEGALMANLFGSAGGALIVAGLWMKVRGTVPSVDGVVALGMTSLGVGIMILGLLFACPSSLLSPGAAACGVGPLAGLIAYSFGLLGAAFAVAGSLQIGVMESRSRRQRVSKSNLAS